MSATRRDVLKIGGPVRGVAGAVSLPWAANVCDLGQHAGPEPDAAVPLAVQPAAGRAAVQEHARQGRSVGRPLRAGDASHAGAGAAGADRDRVRLQRASVPGPTIKVQQGRRAVVRVRNQLPANAPDVRARVRHLGAPARVGVAAAVRRVRQRHHAARVLQGLPLPELPAARTLWYHDHGVHYTAQNAYAGLAAQYHMHDPAERALLPQGEFDVPLTFVGHDVRRDGSLAVRRQRALRAVGRRHPGQRQALAGDEGQAPVYRFRAPERLDLPVVPARRSAPATRCTSSPPTAG